MKEKISAKALFLSVFGASMLVGCLTPSGRLYNPFINNNSYLELPPKEVSDTVALFDGVEGAELQCEEMDANTKLSKCSIILSTELYQKFEVKEATENKMVVTTQDSTLAKKLYENMSKISNSSHVLTIAQGTLVFSTTVDQSEKYTASAEAHYSAQ